MVKVNHNSISNMKTCGKKLALLVLLAMAWTPVAMAFDMSHYADTSKLATGKWVKVAIDHSGIYQITASDASRWVSMHWKASLVIV